MTSKDEALQALEKIMEYARRAIPKIPATEGPRLKLEQHRDNIAGYINNSTSYKAKQETTLRFTQYPDIEITLTTAKNDR